MTTERSNYSDQAEPSLARLGTWWRLMGRSRDAEAVSQVIRAADARVEELEKTLGDSVKERALLQGRHDGLEREHQAQLKVSEERRRSHETLKRTYDFISAILKTSVVEDEKCEDFRRIFHKDFIDFANAENLYQPEAQAVLRMQAVENELRLLSQFPAFRRKKVVAVAGGFSSGKSSLINGLFGSDKAVKLPIGILPVTALPTYVYHAEETQIIGFPAHGGVMKIDEEMWGRIAHDFVSELGFDLKRILPFLAHGTPWRRPMENLCLVDTPGYNPAAGHGATGRDVSVAGEALGQADAVLWVIGLDANGDISVSDIEFLQKNGHGLPLGVVLSKADLRPPSQVDQVLAQVTGTLEACGVACLGVSAYRGDTGTTITGSGLDLHGLLDHWNQAGDREERLSDEVSHVMDDYIKTFKRRIRTQSRLREQLKSLELDLHELGVFDEDDARVNLQKVQMNAMRRLSRLRKDTDVREIKAALKTARGIRAAMREVLMRPWKMG